MNKYESRCYDEAGNSRYDNEAVDCQMIYGAVAGV